MILVLRTLLGIPPPRISPQQAVVIAKTELQRQGKPWNEPVKVAHRLRDYVVWTHANQIGGNLNVFVDIHTGAIKAVRGPTLR
jgi:hypothetical protein